MRRDGSTERVGRLLGRAFSALVVMIVCSGAAGVVTVLLQHRMVSRLTEQVLPLQLANADLRAVLTDAQRGLRGYLLTGDRTLLDTYDAARNDYRPAGQAMVRLATGSDDDVVTAQAARADAWWALADRQRQAPPRSPEAGNFVAAARPLFRAFEEANDALDSSLERRAAELQRHSSMLRTGAVAALGVLTVAAAVIATLTGLRTTRRITGPLGGVVAVLDRLRHGEHDSRADADAGPVEIRTLAGAVNTMADEAARDREREQDIARLRAAVRKLGYRIRHHLAVADAVSEAIGGLPETLRGDHVLIRMAPGVTDVPAVASWRDEHRGGPLEQLAGCPVTWLGVGGLYAGDARAPLAGAGPTAGGTPPEEELQAYAVTGGGPVVTAALHIGDELFGALTLIRDAGAPAWNAVEVRLVESVAADVARGIHHARLYEREQHLVARLKEVDTAKNDFMSTVSHELRTPLTSISGYLEMLRDDSSSLSAGQRRMLDIIDRNTRRLRLLIEDLLLLSKVESGSLRGIHRSVDLAAVVQQASVAVASAATKASVSLRTDVQGPLPVRADPEQLDRVLVNLLSNAVKFTPAQGAVSVTGRRDGDDTVIVVSDTGMGIPRSEQAGLFARFFRASNAIRQAVPGTGLGLAIVRTIVDNHGGRIEVQSAEGAGTAVTVRLPAQD